MTVFELVKLTLDELYKEGIQEHGDNIDNVIKSKLLHLTQQYDTLTNKNRSAIEYRDPATRSAYVFKYVASHADYLVQTLETLKSRMGISMFEKDMLRVSCVGGGPGSDVVGVLKYLSDYPQEKVKRVTCYILDGEQAWQETWAEVGAYLASNTIMNTSLQRLDITDLSSWSAAKNFLKADLFTLSYFVSEVYAFDSEIITSFWKRLQDECVRGAILIYIDNGKPIFDAYFDKQWKNRGDIECLVTENSVRKLIRNSEQKSVLAEYSRKFDHSPKLSSTISIRVLRKR